MGTYESFLQFNLNQFIGPKGGVRSAGHQVLFAAVLPQRKNCQNGRKTTKWPKQRWQSEKSDCQLRRCTLPHRRKIRRKSSKIRKNLVNDEQKMQFLINFRPIFADFLQLRANIEQIPHPDWYFRPRLVRLHKNPKILHLNPQLANVTW